MVSFGEKHSQSHRMMKLILKLQGVAPDQLHVALDGSDEDMEQHRDLFDVGLSQPAMLHQNGNGMMQRRIHSMLLTCRWMS